MIKNKGISKGKATFNLSFDITDKLESRWMELRSMLRKHNVSKSEIVEEALKLLLNDLDKNNKKSEIYKALSRN